MALIKEDITAAQTPISLLEPDVVALGTGAAAEPFKTVSVPAASPKVVKTACHCHLRMRVPEKGEDPKESRRQKK